LSLSLLPESPRWLLTNGRKDEAKRFLKNAARMNKRILPEKIFQDMNVEAETDEGSMLAILKNGVLLRRIGIVTFNW
jgi:hypothetical protein